MAGTAANIRHSASSDNDAMRSFMAGLHLKFESSPELEKQVFTARGIAVGDDGHG
jgi:hypothetical protein